MPSRPSELVGLLAGVLMLPMIDLTTKSAGAQERFVLQFGKDPLNTKLLKFLGPKAGEAIRSSPSGLEIALPRKNASSGRAGVGTHFGIEGDFEITIGYQLADVATPDKGDGAGVMLALVTVDEPPITINMAHRRQRNDESVFGTNVWTTSGKKMKGNFKKYAVAPTITGGKLCIVREGSVLRFLVAEGSGDDYRQLRTEQFGVQAIRTVQVWGDTGGSTQPIKVLFTQLSIHAQQLPYGPRSRQENSIWAVWLMFGLAGTAVFFACAAWYRWRPRQSH